MLNSHSFKVRWTGGDGADALEIFYLTGGRPFPAISTFGNGILTFQVPYVFRTPPGYNLLVRGPANCPKDGVSPLEGLVETDWSSATFTMNWQMTRANHTVLFEEHEPIGMIVPQRRGSIEQFRPEIRPIDSDQDLSATHAEWARSRRNFIGAIPDTSGGCGPQRLCGRVTTSVAPRLMAARLRSTKGRFEYCPSRTPLLRVVAPTSPSSEAIEQRRLSPADHSSIYRGCSAGGGRSQTGSIPPRPARSPGFGPAGGARAS